MRALVTGATGFLGSHVARQLVGKGHDVRALARPTSDRGRLKGLAVDYADGDVTDAASVEAAVDGCDAVFHVAASVEIGTSDVARMEAVNLGGTRNVLGAAASRGLVAVHVSSVAALGPTGPAPVDESWWNPTPPTVDYERTKREAHEYARSLAAGGARVHIGIPGGIYGPDDVSSLGALIKTFMRHPTPVGYMPELVQSVVNVDDCASALVAMAEADGAGREYILCAQTISFRQWFEAIAAAAGRRPPFVYVPTRAVRWSARPAAAVARALGKSSGMITDTVELATRHQAFSGALARHELSWAPRSLAVGMGEIAASL